MTPNDYGKLAYIFGMACTPTADKAFIAEYPILSTPGANITNWLGWVRGWQQANADDMVAELTSQASK